MMPEKGWVRLIPVEKPSLANNTADAQRLEKSLAQELGSQNIRIPLHAVRHLPSRLRAWDFTVKAVLFRESDGWVLLDILPPDSRQPVLGLAVDIGTTRIEMALLDLETGRTAGTAGFDNPQAEIGPDVLTRIHHASRPDGLKKLSRLLTASVSQNLDSLCRSLGYCKEDVYIISGAGNTAMTHLFLDIEPLDLIREPYIPATNIPGTFPARDLPDLGIHENGRVCLFPNAGSYFGGDLVAGILFSELDQKERPALMVDVGTNAEIVVGCRDFLLACAGAAGPALEGGVSRMGMTAGPGVIDRVRIDPPTGKIQVHAIDDQAPVGICGSGMIDMAAALFLSGRMDIQGRLVPSACGDLMMEKDGIPAFVLVDESHSGTGEPIVLTQVDLDSLTRSKAAMYTILEVIVRQAAGLDFQDLETFYVAGTFGSFIDPESAIAIGMLPDIPASRFTVLGNSSLKGAAMLLTQPETYDRILDIRKAVTYIELNVNQDFMNLFSGARFYPHTDISRFPSVKIPVRVNR